MESAAVVENLNVLEDRGAQFESVGPILSVDELVLESGEKAFCNSVVPAIASATHADDDALQRQCATVVIARVLATAIRVMKQSCLRSAAPQRHVECSKRQTSREARVDRPADDRA